MISLKHILVPAILMLTLVGCKSPLYEYKIVCQGAEPATFTDTADQIVSSSVWSSGYITITVRQRRGIILEEHEWTEQVGSGCTFHKKFIGNLEPVGNDG